MVRWFGDSTDLSIVTAGCGVTTKSACCSTLGHMQIQRVAAHAPYDAYEVDSIVEL